MFKKLREKIVEEVRQSPIRFPGNDPFQTVSLGDSPQKVENQGPKPEQFSITDDDGTLSELGSPCKDQNNTSLSGQANENQAETSEMQSHENDHFLFQYQSPQWPTYVPQSDIESEVDDGQTSNLDGVSKEQLYVAAQKLHARVQKYKTKYTEVVKAYKDVNDEKEKIKRALTDTQDKALRRMTELREQCSLEQQAKAHLEQNLRVMLEEKDEMIGVMETKIRLLKEGGGTPETSNEAAKEIAIVDNLVDLGTASPDSQAIDLQEMQNKVKRLEELLGRCKETLCSNKERSTLLMQERDHLASQLEQKEKEILQVQEKELEVQARLRGELSEVREQMKHLEKQQEESVMAMAETKQNMHQELESREQQLAKVKEELQNLYDEADTLKKTVDQKDVEMMGIKEEKEKAIKEMEEKLQRTESTLEEEKQSLMEELARGKTAAIELVQTESSKKLEHLEQEWNNRLSEVKLKLASEHEEKLSQVSSQYQQQIEDAEKVIQEMKDKERKFKSELAKTKVQLQQHQAEVTIMKQKQEDTIQRSEQEKHAINQIEMKLQTLLGEKDKELSHLSSGKENLQQQLTETHQKVEYLTNHSRHLEKELEVLRVELQEGETQAEEREAELSKVLNEEKQKMKTLLEEKAQTLQTSSKSYNDIKEQFELLTLENKENAEWLQTERDTVNRLTSEISTLKANEEELRKTVVELKNFEDLRDKKESKLNSLEQEIAEKDSTISELNEAILNSKELQKHLRDGSSDILHRTSLLRHELSSVKSIGIEFQKDMIIQMGEFCKMAADLQQENKTLAERIGIMQSANDVLESEVKETRVENENLKLSISTMEKQQNEGKKETDLSEKRKLLSFLEENCEHYNGYLKHFDEKITGVISVRHNQLENLKTVLHQLKSNIDTSHKQKEETIEQLRNNIQTKDIEIEELRMQMTLMEVETSELSKSLEEKTKSQNEVNEQLEDQVSQLINKSQVWKQKVMQTQDQLKMERITFEERIQAMEEDEIEKIKLLQEENESHKKKSKELADLIKVAEEQIANLEFTSRSWEEKFHCLQEEKTKIEGQLSEHQEVSRELESRITSLEKLSEENENNVRQKCEEIELLKKQLSNFAELKEQMDSVSSQNQQNLTALQKCKNEWEQKLCVALEDKNRELQQLEESFHLKLAEEKQSISNKKLSEMEEELNKRELALKELQDVHASNQKFTSAVSVLEKELAEKETELQKYIATLDSKNVLVENLSGQLDQIKRTLGDTEILKTQCDSYQKECEDKQAEVLELEKTLRALESNSGLVIQELEEKLANSVSEFESSQIKIQQLQEIIANNSTTQQATEELDSYERDCNRVNFDLEEELSRLREEFEDAQIKKRDLEESEALIKSNNSFLEEQMKVMQENHTKKVSELEMKLELVSAQLDESLIVAEGNQSSTTQEMEDMKSKVEELQKQLQLKNEQLKALENSNEISCERETTMPTLNGNQSSEISDETRTKNQETEDQLSWENKQIRVTMESEIAEKTNALDEMRDYFQQQLQEKQEEINKLKESERRKSKVETSDWDNGWEVEPVEDELYALDKENQKSTTEEMQDSISKYQKEVAELRRLLTLKDGRPSIPDLNNVAQHNSDSFLQPTEYEYLRNIMLEYMMGKEPLTLAKVISAVLRFTDDQTQQILTREEAKQTSVK